MPKSRPAANNAPEQPESRLGPKLIASAGKSQVPEPTCDDDPYPRYLPGDYDARCVGARIYHDPRFRRYLARLDFKMLPEGGPVSGFFNLGAGEKPQVKRGSEYRRAWIVANGEQPRRGQVMSVKIFRDKILRIRIADVTKRSDGREHPAAEVYSTAKEVKQRLWP